MTSTGEELEEILSREAQGRVLVSQELDNRHQVFVNTPVEKRDPIMLLQTLPYSPLTGVAGSSAGCVAGNDGVRQWRR